MPCVSGQDPTVASTLTALRAFCVKLIGTRAKVKKSAKTSSATSKGALTPGEILKLITPEVMQLYQQEKDVSLVPHSIFRRDESHIDALSCHLPRASVVWQTPSAERRCVPMLSLADARVCAARAPGRQPRRRPQ